MIVVLALEQSQELITLRWCFIIQKDDNKANKPDNNSTVIIRMVDTIVKFLWEEKFQKKKMRNRTYIL